MRFVLPILTLLCMLATPAYASPDCGDKLPAEAETQGASFFNLLVAGKGPEAVGNVIASSPLWTARSGAKEQMTGQVDAAVKAYGPVAKWEAYCGTALGTTVFRQYYLVQHRDIVTRWEFDFTRTPTGWKIAYFGFSDQIQTWF